MIKDKPNGAVAKQPLQISCCNQVCLCRKLMYQTAFETNYTALTETGADWVVQHGIKFVGIDYLSIATFEELAPAHQSLMRVVRSQLCTGVCF